MKLVEHSVIDFLSQVDSKSPAPGGGSVAALVGALGCSLSRMVGHLTTSKKKFLELAGERQVRFLNALEQLSLEKAKLTQLVDLDTEAFQLVMAAYALPKTTEAEVTFRKARLLEGTRQSIAVPREVIHAAMAAGRALLELLDAANPNTLSDQGVAILCVSAAVEGAAYNLLINAPGLIDSAERVSLKEEALGYLSAVRTWRETSLRRIESKLLAID
jgi:methenyltetrahydrofolate cyclohydrolase